MNLEVLPVKVKDGSRIFPRRRNTLRVIWIIWESPKAALSGGYTIRGAPSL